MVQWINFLRNNSFINLIRLPLLYEKSGALAIVEPGLTAGWLAGWLVAWLPSWVSGWKADEMLVNFKFLNLL